MSITYCCYGAYCEAGHSPECNGSPAPASVELPGIPDKMPTWVRVSPLLREVFALGAASVEQEQAGAAEVSDEQIEKLAHRMCWQYRHSSDTHHSSTYKFNLTTLLEYTRAALKAGGVA